MITKESQNHKIRDTLTLIGGWSRQDGGVQLLDFGDTLVDLVDACANVFDL